ncbi:MAG: hypothetical protein KIT83_05410 [Bryobacterales bacterium]|nr:hypothetical protein [Bryobacterales bacterium]
MTRNREARIGTGADADIERRDLGMSAEDIDSFLENLRVKTEATLMNDASDLKKVSLSDYLKLMCLIDERRRTNTPAEKEIIVRWEESSEQENACN